MVWRQVESGACGFCGHRHALDIEYRCYGCERGVCAVCLVTVVETREGYCPECAPQGSPSTSPDADEDADTERGGRGGG